jgi:photosystem II stability/assembly factor-like uncharacterized protein
VRRVTLCSFVLALIACSVPSHQTSNKAPNGEKWAGPKIRKMSDVPEGRIGSYTLHCVSSSVCWVGDYLKQWRTDDGGQHWQLIYSGNQFQGEIRTVDYVDERIAWMVTTSKLLRTEDGGQNWIEHVSPIPNSPLGEVTGVKYLKDGRTGWITGGIYRPLTRNERLSGVPRNMSDPPSNAVITPAISHTVDGGKTWIRQSLPNALGRLYVPTFLNERQGVAVGDSGVFYTINSGSQWNYVEFGKSCTDEKYLRGYDFRPLNIFFLDSQNGWLTFADGRIARSSDGGKTWCDLLAPTEDNFASEQRHLEEIHFADLSHGWGLGANGFLYETKDGGKTWDETLTSKFDDMFFLGNETCLLVSKAGLFQLTP